MEGRPMECRGEGRDAAYRATARWMNSYCSPVCTIPPLWRGSYCVVEEGKKGIDVSWLERRVKESRGMELTENN